MHSLVSRHKRYTSLCLALRFANLDLFIFPSENCYRIPDPTSLAQKLGALIPGKKGDIDLLLQSLKPALIHAHFGLNGAAILAYALRSGIPLVTSFYGYDASQLLRNRYWLKRFRYLFKYGDLFLVEGEFMQQTLISTGCPAEKIRVQRIGIPLEQFAFRSRSSESENSKVIFVFCGRFVEKKGLICALEALKRLRARYDCFEFRIIGDGPLKKRVLKFISRHNMEGYVKLLGFLNYREHIRQMQESDILVMPSMTAANGDSEGGAPTVILEAQAMGIPVVSTFHADIPNICLPGKSALLSPEADPEALFLNLETILTRRDLWEPMGRAGREFVSAYHDIDRYIDELEAAYDTLS